MESNPQFVFFAFPHLSPYRSQDPPVFSQESLFSFQGYPPPLRYFHFPFVQPCADLNGFIKNSRDLLLLIRAATLLNNKKKKRGRLCNADEYTVRLPIQRIKSYLKRLHACTWCGVKHIARKKSTRSPPPTSSAPPSHRLFLHP